ncbi:hypothetical protein Ciccas_013321, partial [Cichlidogyrus casuarinus]
MLFFAFCVYLFEKPGMKHSDATRLSSANFRSYLRPVPEESKVEEEIFHMNDLEILDKLQTGKIKSRELEGLFPHQLTKAVNLRRAHMAEDLSDPHTIDRIPYLHYDYKPVLGQCCEEVIGYIPIPLGRVGPLLVDGRQHYVAMATTEGCLVASANRGCRVICQAGGAASVVFRDQMTRAPVLQFDSIQEVVNCIAWLQSDLGFTSLKQAFDSTSSHADLLSIFPNPV